MGLIKGYKSMLILRDVPYKIALFGTRLIWHDPLCSITSGSIDDRLALKQRLQCISDDGRPETYGFLCVCVKGFWRFIWKQQKHQKNAWYDEIIFAIGNDKRSASIPTGVEVVRQSVATISVVANGIKIATKEFLNKKIRNKSIFW